MTYLWMKRFSGGRGRGLFGCEKEIKIRSFSILKPQQEKGRIELEGSLMKTIGGLRKQRILRGFFASIMTTFSPPIIHPKAK